MFGAATVVTVRAAGRTSVYAVASPCERRPWAAEFGTECRIGIAAALRSCNGQRIISARTGCSREHHKSIGRAREAPHIISKCASDYKLRREDADPTTFRELAAVIFVFLFYV